jgi:uncharacterized protein (TIGR03437 family)
MSGTALYRCLRDILFCAPFIIMTLRAQITEYAAPFVALSGIAAGPDGAMWFSGRGNIGRITTFGVVTSYPLPTSGAGAAGITAGSDGAMWFTEYSNNTLAKIGRITTSGVFTEYALPNPASEPTTITAGPDGALYFIEAATTNIGRITTSGTITEFPLPKSVENFGVAGIAAGPDGNLWFTQNYGYNGILRMTTAGVFTAYPISTAVNYGSYGITAGPDGALWFADSGNVGFGPASSAPPGKVGRITTSGTITEYPLPQAGDYPLAIAAGPDGALWFTDYLGQIGRITTSGTVTSEVPTPTNTGNGDLGYYSDSIAAGPDGAMWFIEAAAKIGRIPTGVTVTPPTITLVANAESGAPTIAPNTWVEIKGSNLAKAGDSRIWLGSDFVNGQMPTELDGVSVTLNGQPAYVYYISPAQVNILTPPGTISGSAQIQVTNNGAVSATFAVQAQTESPSFFVFNGGPYIAATHLNGSLIGPATLYPGYSTPAQPGETIVIYANGFGATSTPVVSGSSSQSGSLSPLPVIDIGAIGATVTFAGLVAPGEFQFNVVVPSSLANGDQPVTAMYVGLTTQAGTLLTVHQ